MIGSVPKAEVVLPFGVADAKGRRSRSAVLIPISGRGELLGGEDSNPFRVALQLLATSTTRLGPFQGDEVDLALLSSLLPIDRDFLLISLARLTFGDVRYQTVVCPSAGCEKRLDLRLDLSTATAPPVDDALPPLALPDGRLVRFRRPTSGDQVALHGLQPDELEAAFLGRLLTPQAGEPQGVSAEEAALLPTEVRQALVQQILAASPDLELITELTCVECGAPFSYELDPVTSLIDELRLSRSALLEQIHSLAFYYHWSPTEILQLSRAQRAEFLQVLDAELGAHARAGVR